MDRWTKRYYNPKTGEVETKYMNSPRRKVFIRAFLVELLELSPSQVSRLFAPMYHTEKIQNYLKAHGYRPHATLSPASEQDKSNGAE